jgi:pimeloyl-ACP methyl ester carboxylesterase
MSRQRIAFSRPATAAIVLMLAATAVWIHDFPARAAASLPPAVAAMQAAFAPAPCPVGEWTAPEVPVKPRAGARAFNGSYEGGLYKVEIPEKWNGELVLWAHGFVAIDSANGRRLRAPDHPLRDHLIDNGFAWASSSYRCNGYVAGQALIDTMALIDLFTKNNAGRAPSRTYFTGGSMGGYAALLAMHEMPDRLAGALPLCHAGPGLPDYFIESARAAARVANMTLTRPTLEDDMTRVAEAVGTPPNYTDAGRAAARAQIEAGGGPRPFAVEGLEEYFLGNIRLGAPGLLPDPPDYTKYREQQPFSGRLTKPVITLHTTGDMFVPILMQRQLRQAVAKAGRDQYLVQRIIRAAGHCTFSPAETTAAFDDLVAWVRTGRRPEGDDVMASLRDAGRRFTNPLRPGDPGTVTIR